MSVRFRHQLFTSLALPGVAFALAAAPPAIAQPAAPAEGLIAFDIAAGPLDGALMAFMRQSHLQLIYKAQTVQGRRAPALKGRFRAEDALARLLAGSDVQALRTGPGVVVLKSRLAPAAAGPGDPAPAPAPTHGVGAADSEAPAPRASAANTPSRPRDETAVLSEVVITGSLIHGGRETASPIVALDRQALDRSGQATVADLLSQMPQNFGGSASPDTALIGTDGRSTNDSVAKGVNLRGLGATATLVLVNGRRMAGAGLKGDFADVSAIPTAAVERVEVLLDGASAIYGSDAVGGVVNIILRRDFDGAESRVRLGAAAGGTAGQAQVSHIFGASWRGGHAILAYEFQHDDDLAAVDRPFTATADLRAMGGTDHRLIFSHPGNILTYSPAAGGFVSAWAIPAGQNGVGLKPSDFIAGGKNLENYRALSDIEPAQDRHSLIADLRQSLTPHVTLELEGRYTRRAFDYDQPPSTTISSVTSANPYFVSPNGSASHLIGYAFGDELGPIRSHGTSESFGLSAELDLDLPHSWRGEVYGAFAQEKSHRRSDNEVNGGYLNEALGVIPDNPATAFSPARDGYFNPFGDGRANSAAVLAFIGSGWEASWSRSRVATFNAKADGALFDLPGGPLKAAVGVQLRQERFTPRAQAVQSGVTPVTTGGATFARTVQAAFVELRAPLLGPDNAVPGMRRLELSLAGRAERYQDVGTTTNPKFGLLWSPVSGLNVRATYGTSFRAPALTEVYALEAIAPTFLNGGGAQNLVLLQYGGNRALKPETATSWTFGTDLAPARWPGLTLSATWFDIRFRDQIGKPVLENLASALTDPSYAPFVSRISPGSNPQDLARLQALIARSTSPSIGLFPATAYTAIVDARNVNAAEAHVRGFDLAAGYGVALGADRLDLAASATYLADFQRRLTPAAPSVQLVDRAGQPVDLRARLSATWTHGAFAATLGVNYVDDYATPAGGKVDAWTTADAQLVWRSGRASGPLSGLVLAVSAQNLFDTDPPFYDAPQGVGYDPANADPLGRFVSVQLTKRW